MDSGPERSRVAVQARPISPDARLLSVPQVAAVLGLGVDTVRDMVAAGKLPTVDVGVRRILVDRLDLDAWIAARRTTSPQ